jgi:hypothetical protein
MANHLTNLSASNPSPATISDIEKMIELALEALRPAPLSQNITSAFPYLLPSGMRPRVQLEEDGRKKRSTAAASNWNPETGEIVIYFERPDPESTPNPGVHPHSGPTSAGFIPFERAQRFTNEDLQSADAPEITPLQIQQCCEALAEAEKAGKAFIALKWFRDSGLIGSGYSWADSLAHRQAVIAKAIEVGAILTAPIPNPKAPQHPTTTVKLNRDSEYAKTVVRRFQPIRPRGGESASEIVLRDRGRL